MTAPSERRRVLIVVPAYNEEARLEAPLRSYLAFARARADLDVRFLVVLNGCRDGTAAVVERVARDAAELSWMEYAEPIGKGGALLAGFRHHAGVDWVGFVDADGATPAASLFGLLDESAADVVVGRRATAERPFGRRVTSLGFNLAVRLLLGLTTRDTQCGAKFFRSSLMPAILEKVDTCDMAVDVDLLLAARSVGAVVSERPVTWADQPGSKVQIFRTSALMFLSVWRLLCLRRLPPLPGRALLRVGEWAYAGIYGCPRKLPPGSPDRSELR